MAPNDGMLELLRTEWRKELKKLLKKQIARKTAGISALAAAFDDPSVPNQSSIVLLLVEQKTHAPDGRRPRRPLSQRSSHGPTTDLPSGGPLQGAHHGSGHTNGPSCSRP